MSTYCINPIGGSNGFKVHIADEGGGLRVVGVFFTETAAQAWIATDRRPPESSDGDGAPELAPRT
jgi:hypothetical protein